MKIKLSKKYKYFYLYYYKTDGSKFYVAEVNFGGSCKTTYTGQVSNRTIFSGNIDDITNKIIEANELFENTLLIKEYI